jgi:hypothetical protein
LACGQLGFPLLHISDDLSMNTDGAPSTDPTDMLKTMTITHPDKR